MISAISVSDKKILKNLGEFCGSQVVRTQHF